MVSRPGIRVDLVLADRSLIWNEVARWITPDTVRRRDGRGVMPDDRLLRILSRLAADDGGGEAARGCVRCAPRSHEMRAPGSCCCPGISRRARCARPTPSARMIEELQYTLGEGPCVDAHRQHTPVVEPDLADPATAAWAAFARAGRRCRRPSRVRVPGRRSATSTSAPSTCTATGPGRSPTISTPTPSWWPTSPLAPSSTMQADAAPGATRAGARGGRQLPLRRAPGRRHGRRAAGHPRRRGPVRLRAHAFSTRPHRLRRRRRRDGTPAALRRRSTSNEDAPTWSPRSERRRAASTIGSGRAVRRAPSARPWRPP